MDSQPLFTSEKFPSLHKDVLFGLLKRNDLHVEEIDAWNCLIKWGIEQTPELRSKNSDRTKWNQENFKALRETLNPFIPLIRFSEISRANFFDKVRPYKAVFPHHIYEEVIEFYYKKTLPKTILPSRIGKVQIESKLIKPKLADIIASWIERNNVNRKKYKFELLYRSSRDGIHFNAFRNKCNGHGPCLVLVKQQLSTKIYGGYNPLNFVGDRQWLGQGQWYNTSESFIFSFDDDNDTTSMKISRVNRDYKCYAIYEHYGQGFSFGQTFYMYDQYINFNYNGYYDLNIMNNSDSVYFDNSFIPEEIEVFKINSS